METDTEHIDIQEVVKANPAKQAFFVDKLNEAVAAGGQNEWLFSITGMKLTDCFVQFEEMMRNVLELSCETDKDKTFLRLRTAAFLFMLHSGSPPTVIAYFTGIPVGIVANIYTTYCLAISERIFALPRPSYLETRNTLISSLRASAHSIQHTPQQQEQLQYLLSHPTLIGVGTGWQLNAYSALDASDAVLLSVSAFLDLQGNVRQLHLKPYTESGLPPQQEAQLALRRVKGKLTASEKRYFANEAQREAWMARMTSLRVGTYAFLGACADTPDFSDIICDAECMQYWRHTFSENADVFRNIFRKQLLMDHMLQKHIADCEELTSAGNGGVEERGRVHEGDAPIGTVLDYTQCQHGYQEVYEAFFGSVDAKERLDGLGSGSSGTGARDKKMAKENKTNVEQPKANAKNSDKDSFGHLRDAQVAALSSEPLPSIDIVGSHYTSFVSDVASRAKGKLHAFEASKLTWVQDSKMVNAVVETIAVVAAFIDECTKGEDLHGVTAAKVKEK